MVKDIVKDDIIKILDDILKEFEKFDGSIESGIEIIELNRISIDRLKELFGEEGLNFDKTYQHKMELIIFKQRKLLKILEGEKKELLEKMQQINKKNKVVNNYMSTAIRPIFVDKNT
ncbi:MAG: hypothetical protein RIN55_02015 [Tissierellaceae bacterium]|nr:hypothetical protein [Tissierellaceae bacterium]